MLFFRRTPPNDDQAMGDLSTAFFFNPDDPTFGAGLLNPSRLNFSVESLEHVNDYLEMVRLRPELPQHAQQVVMRAGAYLGEVIRKHAEGVEYHWYTYDKAVKISSQVATFGKSVSTAAVLVATASMMVFPLAKVASYLTKGRSEDIHVFAKQTLATVHGNK